LNLGRLPAIASDITKVLAKAIARNKNGLIAIPIMF
jgi:hypothetical protein